MEYRNVVYNAARDGKINRLKIFLDHKSKDEVVKLVHAKTNGATPLIMACRNGHLDVVRYLLELCKADLEQVGCVTFDGETIEGAPPLWCAAAAGHTQIVKYLVEKGSGVNKTTFTNSTPLRAACFDGHIEIVKFLVEHKADIEIANRHGHTCLMISCYKGHKDIAKFLLELGADVNRKSVKGDYCVIWWIDEKMFHLWDGVGGITCGEGLACYHYQISKLSLKILAGNSAVELVVTDIVCFSN